VKLDSKGVVHLLVCRTLTFSVSFVGAQGSLRGLGEWYSSLQKPPFNPPNWLFAPEWTTLYLLMGIAAFQIWQSKSARRPLALTVYAVQLLLNGLWSWIFFAWQRLLESAIEISVMWVLIVVTMVLFGQIHRRASWMLTPYLAWVSFATVLNWTIYGLNR
jgi:tryptophan-rich sensory protein